ncbi:MAG: M56 family metallopeptidase [Cyanobacteria bacterium SID2]|nr:M56 family metallopeptidase [Cyanobacteria bacterium SID2]MBP0003014.1 M56 family metallopeptidase [Cyanobacteria bacterium SBC]
MHLLMVLAAILGGFVFRCCYDRTERPGYRERWYAALTQLVFPSVLLVTTTLAVVCMGNQGQMVWPDVIWTFGDRSVETLSYGISSIFLAMAAVRLAARSFGVWRSVRSIRRYPQHQILSHSCRVFDHDVPFSAVVGFWTPELTIGRGLLETLNEDQLNAVLAHERGHLHYRDTFWFFWLGWLKRLTPWLPKTEAIWQELLLLREIRADRWAAQQVDELLLAESLLKVASAPSVRHFNRSFEAADDFQAALSCDAPRSRLEERIDALLDETPPIPTWQLCLCKWLAVALVPLSIVPFHY